MLRLRREREKREVTYLKMNDYIRLSLDSLLSSSSKKREVTGNQLITFHILLSAYAAALLVMGDRTKMPWLLELLFQNR